MKEKWTPHIIAVGAFAVFIVLGLACANEGSTTDYKETVSFPGMKKSEVYVKTILWLMEKRTDEQKIRPFEFKIDTVSESIISIKLLTLWNQRHLGEGDQLNNNVRFSIYDESCNLYMSLFYMWRIPPSFMDTWKNIAKNYQTYITAPPVSLDEINTLILKGDEEFEKKQFAVAEKYYRQALNIKPLNADVLAKYGLCMELCSNRTENYKKTTDDPWLEKRKLREDYNYDNNNYLIASYLYKIALNIDRNNKLVLFCIENNKEKQAYIDNLNSLFKSNLDDSVKQIEEERAREAERQAQLQKESEEKWNKISKVMDSAIKIAEIYQQSQGGGNTGSQGQGGASGGSASSSDEGSSSSSGGDRHIANNPASAQRTYNNYAKAARGHYDNIVNAKKSDEPSSRIRQLEKNLRDCQKQMRDFRLEAKKQGVDIREDPYETKQP